MLKLGDEEIEVLRVIGTSPFKVHKRPEKASKNSLFVPVLTQQKEKLKNNVKTKKSQSPIKIDLIQEDEDEEKPNILPQLLPMKSNGSTDMKTPEPEILKEAPYENPPSSGSTEPTEEKHKKS